jgi:hypothetical protein
MPTGAVTTRFLEFLPALAADDREANQGARLAPMDLVQGLCDAFVAAVRWKIRAILAFFMGRWRSPQHTGLAASGCFTRFFTGPKKARLALPRAGPS